MASEKDMPGVFVCKIHEQYMLLHETNIPPLSWLRGKLSDARRQGPALGEPVRGVHGMLMLDLDGMIDHGAIRDIPATDMVLEKQLMRDLLSLLLQDKEQHRMLRQREKFIRPYKDIADYLGIDDVPEVRKELDSLVPFPRENCTFVITRGTRRIRMHFTDHAAVVDYGEESVWKFAYKMYFGKRATLLEFQWPDDAAPGAIEKTIVGMVMQKQGDIIQYSALHEVTHANDTVAWTAYTERVTFYAWKVHVAQKKEKRKRACDDDDDDDDGDGDDVQIAAAGME